MPAKFFYGLKFELRDKITNNLFNNLKVIINVNANHELILEQEAVTKKTSMITKPAISTPGVVRSFGQQVVGNNPNKRKHDGDVVPTSVETMVENIHIIVLNRLSILIVRSWDISRKIASCRLRNKSKTRLEITFH